jgi:hypothetical protein
LTIPAGVASAAITVAIINDSLDEPNETFNVTLSAAVGGTIADARGLGTIVDNDSASTTPPASTPSTGALLDVELYYPLRVGDVRLMAVTETIGAQSAQFLEKELIGSSFFGGGVQVFDTSRLDPDCWGAAGEQVFWDSEGFKYLSLSECEANQIQLTEFDPPFLLLPRQMEPGQTESRVTGDGMLVMVTLEAVGETVQVPAGTFSDTLRIRWQITDTSASSVCRIWLAAGIGTVREECTDTTDLETVTESREMVSLLTGGQLIGSPLLVGDGFSAVGLAVASGAACGLAVNNIVVQGDIGPELWAAQFAFDLGTLRWNLVAFGPGTAGPPDAACAIQGLDFASPALMKVGRDDLSGLPEIWMRVPVLGQTYVGAFLFDPASFSLNPLPGLGVLQ